MGSMTDCSRCRKSWKSLESWSGQISDESESFRSPYLSSTHLAKLGAAEPLFFDFGAEDVIGDHVLGCFVVPPLPAKTGLADNKSDKLKKSFMVEIEAEKSDEEGLLLMAKLCCPCFCVREKSFPFLGETCNLVIVLLPNLSLVGDWRS